MTSEQRDSLAALIDGLVHPDARDRRVALLYRGEAIGSLQPEFADYLARRVDWLRGNPARMLEIAPVMSGAALESAWQALARQCRADGWAPAWRDEDYDLLEADGNHLCRLERGVFRPFGLHARAVHLNGYTPDGRLWIARRAATKAVDPNQLDNLVGGGVSAGELPQESLLRECAEEAGIAVELAGRARRVDQLDALRREFDGLHNETITLYDLALPADFRPLNQDGEVAAFRLMDQEELLPLLLAGAFTADAGAVTAHWLLRHAR